MAKKEREPKTPLAFGVAVTVYAAAALIQLYWCIFRPDIFGRWTGLALTALWAALGMREVLLYRSDRQN